MGIRSLICVVKNGEYKVAQYSQWDGYPKGQGLWILQFLKNEFNKNLFERKLSQVSYANDEDLEQMDIEVNKKGCSYKSLYPENNRDTGADILSIIQNTDKPLKIISDLDFAGDSLYCEWAYVIDLDKNTFEIYEGFNRTPLNKNERFYNFKGKKSMIIQCIIL